MSSLSAGAHADVVLAPGEVLRVSTGGVATVVTAYGAPAGTTTITANTQDFGPYSVAAKLAVNSISGSASYSSVAAYPVVRMPDGTLQAGGSPVSGGGRISLNASFDQAIAVAGIPLVDAYTFGTAAVAPAGGKAVRNLTDLALYFNAFEDFTGTTTINSELQRYQDFNPANHAFAAASLDLVALLPGGTWTSRVTQASSAGYTPNGTAQTLVNMGLSDTTGLRVGQLVCGQYKGIYYINALVADTSVSLTTLGGSPTTVQNNNLVAFLPIDSAALSSAHTNLTDTLVFASLPPQVVVGSRVGFVNGNTVLSRNEDYFVAEIIGSTVRLNKSTKWGNLASGTRILFLPEITSGQIWTKGQWDLSSESRAFAVEFDVNILVAGSQAETLIRNVNTVAAYNALSAEVPWGAWPALWAYSADDGLGGSRDASELDWLEMWWSTTNGPTYFLGNNLGNGVGTKLMNKTNESWTVSGNFNVSPSSLVGNHKIQFVFKDGQTFRYLDGKLLTSSTYRWCSQAPLQIGLNLAMGAITSAYGSNISVPLAPQNFVNARFGIKGVRIWHA